MLLSDIMSARNEITVEVKNPKSVLKVGYLPNKITPEFESSTQTTVDNPFTSDRFAKMLDTVMADWDVLDGNGIMIPITFQNLRQFPTVILADIVTGIMEDLNPPVESLPDLNNSSSVPAGQELPEEDSVPIGIH